MTDAIAALDEYVDLALADYNFPGAAVLVIDRGEIVYSRGHGLREAGSLQRVNDDTLFQIGSVTKPFTTLALALLVAESRLSWDDPVATHLPEFELHDPALTAKVTVRD